MNARHLSVSLSKDSTWKVIISAPATPIEPFEALLEQADMVLVMSVNPGFGGQSFMDDQLDKVRWLYKKREEKQLNYRIEIDGGINHETYKKACDAGCDTLVAGSYVFNGDLVSNVRHAKERMNDIIREID